MAGPNVPAATSPATVGAPDLPSAKSASEPGAPVLPTAVAQPEIDPVEYQDEE